MSLVDDSLSSDDFAAFLDVKLDSVSDKEEEEEEQDKEDEDEDEEDADENYKYLIPSTKRRKTIVSESTQVQNGPTSHTQQEITTIETSVKEDICTHSGSIKGMCFDCGEKMDNDNPSGVAFGYIHKDLRITNDEIARLRNENLKNLLPQKKLYLVLDLDHTLLHSIPEAGYLMNPTYPMQDALKGSLFKVRSMQMVTKLRPFVHTFLKEASKLFEMYIYTMGERSYALEMAKLLDPEKVYFDSKVFARNDCTKRLQKGLDVVPVPEHAVIILDDTESVWAKKDRDNLILMEEYNFFASSCGDRGKSLAELRSDESEEDGALATVLKVLKRVHTMFFDSEPGENFTGRDVRQMLRGVRGEAANFRWERQLEDKFPVLKDKR